MPATLAAIAAALCCRDPVEKCRQVARLAVEADDLDFAAWSSAVRPDVDGIPGRPEKPALVAPRDVPQRGLGSVAGRNALMHAVAHIEFNAINLALDAILRFPGMPADYYRDWLVVADDEARHFGWLAAHLAAQGVSYGDLPAHNGLWEACEKTAGDVLLRMALVPRVLEARGLDVTPGMIRRLTEVGDHAAVTILERILDEEVAHVAAGTRWYRWCCTQRGFDADALWPNLLEAQGVIVRPPLNVEARRNAGFTRAEMPDALQADFG